MLKEFDHIFPGTLPLVCALRECQFEQTSNRVCNLYAKHGRFDFLKYFLAQEKSINSRTLEIAASNRHTECVQFIHDWLLAGREPRHRAKNLSDVTNVTCKLEDYQNPVSLSAPVGKGGTYCCVLANGSRKVECLKFLLSVHDTRPECITITAVQTGLVEMLQCAVTGVILDTGSWKFLRSPHTLH